MKPIGCLDANCTGGDHCSMCINRNIIAKEGYDLIRIIECIPASVEQTQAVTAAERFIKIAETAALKVGEQTTIVNDDLWYRTVQEPPLTEVDAIAMSKFKELIQLWGEPVKDKNGRVFGTVAQQIRPYHPEDGFITTIRGKKDLEKWTYVRSVDHVNRIVTVAGEKATLNAPLLDYIFKTLPKVEAIVHQHREYSNLPVLPYAPPGTVRDSIRDITTSFNIQGHGSFLLYQGVGCPVFF